MCRAAHRCVGDLADQKVGTASHHRLIWKDTTLGLTWLARVAPACARRKGMMIEPASCPANGHTDGAAFAFGLGNGKLRASTAKRLGVVTCDAVPVGIARRVARGNRRTAARYTKPHTSFPTPDERSGS